ncbi:MAG: calcium/sodium antiporter [Lewinellaceae bacterium]|nr:calcium/sodium antiporter [Lewinella sp.]MCB9278841.1 calcium/sodium antiporter [Lewinellaceae bacterium]
MGDLLLYSGLFVLSLAVLLKASDWFINAAESIGLGWGIPPFIIGVTIVAFGTSLPELATSIAAVLSGNSEIVIGNVVGSNITNIALVLGLSALVSRQMIMENDIWKMDMPFLWASAFLLWFVLADRHFTLFEALIFMGGIAIFLGYTFKSDTSGGETMRYKVSWRTYAMLAVGGALVWLGADYTIFAIQKLSVMAGIPSEIIALSAVAIGTSLPEIIVSIKAARKGKPEIAVGNVLGSNVFNTFVVMGVPSFFGKLVIPENILSFHLPLMVAMTVLFGIISNNRIITRWEGLVLLLFFLVFMSQLAVQTL